MTLKIALAIVLIPLVASAAPQTLSIPNGPPVLVHGQLPDARSLLAAELAAEKQSEAEGPARALRSMMDPVDGLSFAGGEPSRGAEAIFAAHGGDKPSGKLSWVPAEVFVSPELGATWGHFTFTPPGSGGAAVKGKYVTVWRRETGHWLGVIDFGAPD